MRGGGGGLSNLRVIMCVFVRYHDVYGWLIDEHLFYVGNINALNVIL